MKSLFKVVTVVSLILAFPLVSIKIQAQDDGVRACVLQATRDFRIVVAAGAMIEVERSEIFGQAVSQYGENQNRRGMV